MIIPNGIRKLLFCNIPYYSKYLLIEYKQLYVEYCVIIQHRNIKLFEWLLKENIVIKMIMCFGSNKIFRKKSWILEFDAKDNKQTIHDDILCLMINLEKKGTMHVI